MSTLRIVEKLGPDAAAWDALIDAMALPSPFLRSWWLEATAGDAPRFALVDGDRGLAGGLALQEERVGGLIWLRHAGAGYLHADHLDMVAAPHTRAVVAQEVHTWLARPGSRMIELSGMAEHAAARDALPAPVRQRVVAKAPWGPLPASYDEYLAARPSVLRSTIRRTDARLTKLGAVHRRVEDQGVPAALDELRRFHQARYGRFSGLLPEFEAFKGAAIEGSKRGEVACHEIVLDGRVIASEVWFEVAGVASFYQSGRDNDPAFKGSGTLLKARVINDLCDRKFKAIDLLRVDEPYKRAWVSEARSVVALESASGVVGRAAFRVAPLGRSAFGAARRVARGVRNMRRLAS
jgi:CelD/BcsL family acetyltransferase involved in cellulose biosynthesis